MTFELRNHFENDWEHCHDHDEEQWRELSKEVSEPGMSLNVVTNRWEDLGKSRQIAQSCDEADGHGPEKHQEDTKSQPKQSSKLFPSVT